MDKVTIVICWRDGTEAMVRTCLNSIARHTLDSQYELLLVSTDKSWGDVGVAGKLKGAGSPLSSVVLAPPEGKESSRLHGWMLDKVIPERIATEYFLTLDSDCFPVADGWLDDLVGMVKEGSKLAGILHPWAPPPADMPSSKIEYRVRSQHCWLTTHVACQLMMLSDYKRLYDAGCRFNAGDDTGLLVPKMTRAGGGRIEGFKLTRCPIVWDGDLDPEFNRYSCLVFGDKVYHHGGFSRSKVLKDDPVFGRSFGWCEELVLWGGGAEFLLNDRFGYRFKFNREEEVAKEKMQRLFGLKAQRMSG